MFIRKEAATGDVLGKRMFLKISQNSHENALFNNVSSFNFFKKESLAQVFSGKFCKISKNIFFIEHFRTTAPEWLEIVKRCMKSQCAEESKTDGFIVSLVWSQPVGIYLLKFNNRNIRTRCQMRWKLTIKTPECRCRRCSIFIYNFEHISYLVLVFLLLTLNMPLPSG